MKVIQKAITKQEQDHCWSRTISNAGEILNPGGSVLHADVGPFYAPITRKRRKVTLVLDETAFKQARMIGECLPDNVWVSVKSHRGQIAELRGPSLTKVLDLILEGTR